MNQVGKNILIVLTLGIVMTALINQSNISSNDTLQSSIQETIDSMEGDIDAGYVVGDGVLNSGNQDFVVPSGNQVGAATGKVGNFIAKIIGKIIEFFAKLFGSLVS